MIYDADLKRGVRKKFLPEPNPSRLKISYGSSLLDLQKK